MRHLLKRRLKALTYVILSIATIAGLMMYERYQLLRTATLELIEQQEVIAELQGSILLGTFLTQGVDSYIYNLGSQIKLLTAEARVEQIKLQNADTIGIEDVSRVTEQLQEITGDLESYRLDQRFMAVASLDYRLLRLNPILADAYHFLVQAYAQGIFTLTTAAQPNNEASAVYVSAGQIIGTQGCSGVCTGTHLHFVVSQNNQAIDPCSILPSRTLSRWGELQECGSLTGTLSWPLGYPWIVTQAFGVHSDVTNDTHLAIDLIDREFGPVFAAHSGWLSYQERGCAGAAVCNGGAAKIVTICESQDCTQGLKTEYWHLSWSVAELYMEP